MTLQKSNSIPKDQTFEKKRDEHHANIAVIESKLEKLRARMAMISDEVRSLTANDSTLSAREEVKTQIEILKAKKDQLINLKNPLFHRLQDAQTIFRRKMDDLQVAKDKLPYKRIEDVDKLLADFDAQVTSGQLKLIEEKRIVAEMSKLRKARKQIESFNGDSSMVELKKTIDILRANIQDKDNEIKNINDQLNNLHAQYGQYHSSRSASQNKIKILMAEKNNVSKSVNQLFEEKNALFDSYKTAQKAHAQWFRQQKISMEETHIQRDIDYHIRQLEQEMNNLQIPAHSSEIQDATNIQNFLKNNILKEMNTITAQTVAAPSRSVEPVNESLVMTTKFNREEETYLNFGKIKKSAPKKAASAPISDQLKLPIWILAGLEALHISSNVPLVCKKEDVHELIEALEQTKKHFLQDQEIKSSTVDVKKQAIEEKIKVLKARNVHEEALLAVQLKDAQKKTAASVSQGAPGLTVQG